MFHFNVCPIQNTIRLISQKGTFTFFPIVEDYITQQVPLESFLHNDKYLISFQI